MTNTEFEWQLDEFMVYCRSRQLRERTMASYEQTLRLFERWCMEQMNITDVDKITESVVRRYINDLQTRGKYSFYSNDKGKEKNFPDRRRDFRKPISVCTINNYIRNLRVFFNWLDGEYILKRNPMKKIQQLKVNRKAKDYIRAKSLCDDAADKPIARLPVAAKAHALIALVINEGLQDPRVGKL